MRNAIALLVAFLFLCFIMLIDKDRDLVPVQRHRLQCLDAGLIAASKEARSIEASFETCEQELRDVLATSAISDPSLGALKAIFATLVAHNSAPYGSSKATKFDDLLAAPQLACGNYVLLTGHYFPNPNLRYVGFEGGAVGNHAQILYTDGSISLLLDPSLGIVAETSFDDLLMGETLDRSQILSFYSYPETALDGFYNTTLEALSDGMYRPSDLLYFYESVHHYLNSAKYDRYLTPGGMRLRHRR